MREHPAYEEKDLAISSEKELKEAKKAAGVRKTEGEALLYADKHAKYGSAEGTDHQLRSSIAKRKVEAGTELNLQLSEAANVGEIEKVVEEIKSLEKVEGLTPEEADKKSEERAKFLLETIYDRYAFDGEKNLMTDRDKNNAYLRVVNIIKDMKKNQSSMNFLKNTEEIYQSLANNRQDTIDELERRLLDK